jgi:ABC-type transporter Mla subunit MlaD
MSLQDLTPQLRTRLSRLERVVGLFVTIGTLLLLAGLAYYIYQIAKRKGWFLQKLPYYTFVNNANGLKVGNRIRLMGFDVGEITQIEGLDPFDPYDVYVQFRVWEPYYGYIWEDSRAKIFSADLLGNRYIELTKGSDLPPSYLFEELRVVTLADLRQLAGRMNFALAQTVYETNNLVFDVYTPLKRETVDRLIQLGISPIKILDKSAKRKKPTGVWDEQLGQYVTYTNGYKGYWLRVEESPALTERMERIVNSVEGALPDILALTNKLASVLTNAAAIVEHADELLVSAKPVVTNFTRITANLSGPKGSLGEWIFPTNLSARLDATLASANLTVSGAHTNLQVLSSNLVATLENVANLTSNLNAQVQANGMILSEISSLIVNTDEMVQGLKRHWLLRSSFGPHTNAPLQPIVKPRIGQ